MELVEYYRFYRNSPMVVSVRYMELMDQYWGKSKAVYYRRIKRELEMVEESSELSG